MSDISTADVSYAGVKNLIATEELVHYNDHVFEIVKRVLPAGGKFLEFGAGLGEFTARFSRAGILVDCVEIDGAFHDRLKGMAGEVFRRLADLAEPYDAIVSINVLEHIEDDRETLRDMFSSLRTGGVLSLYVPAHPALYGPMDASIGHFRRYTKDELKGKVASAGFKSIQTQWVDGLGFFVSLINKRWGDQSGRVSASSMRFYDNVIFPVGRVVDFLSRGSFGRNLFLSAVK